jgi:hypothetical protein
MKPAAPWVLHMLGRTLATGMGEIGVQRHVIEAVLNHISGDKGDVAGAYNRTLYVPEKAQAPQRWADYVEILVVAGDAAANIIRIRRL